MKKNFSLPIKYEQQQYEDDRFLKLKIYVMHDGVNLNESNFDMNAIESAKDSISNIPILAFVKEVDGENEMDFAGHEMELVIKDDDFKFRYLGRPIGVIPADNNNYHYEIIDDLTYVVVDGYVWKDYANDALDILENDQIKSQSMEISVSDFSFSDNGICNILGYKYTGVCLLGDDVTPAMVGARAEVLTPQVFNLNEIKNTISNILFELKSFDDSSKIDIDNSKASADMTGSWGSVSKTSLRNNLIKSSNSESLVKEAYLVVDNDWKNAPSESLHYPHHEIKDDKLVVHKAGLEAAYQRLMANDPHNEQAINHLKKHYKELGLDMSNFEVEGGKEMEEEKEIFENVEKLDEPSDEMKKQDPEDKMEQDDDDKEDVLDDIEEIVEDVLGDQDGDEGGDDSDADGDGKSDYELKYQELNSNYEKLLEEHNQLKESYESILSEVDELKQFKASKLQQEREVEENEVFDKFSEELTEEEMKPLREKSSEYTLEELEDKLFALAGRKKVKFSVKKEKDRINMGLNIVEKPQEKVVNDIWAEAKMQFSQNK